MAYQQAKEALNPVASISGTIQELYVHNGDSVNAGAQIAKITSSMDLSIDFLFPYDNHHNDDYHYDHHHHNNNYHNDHIHLQRHSSGYHLR